MASGDDSTVVERPGSRPPTGPTDVLDAAPGSPPAPGATGTDVADTDPIVGRDAESGPLRSSKDKLNDHADLVTVDPSHYVIGPELARGGMGRIHAARDRRLGRDVAIKELLLATDNRARRFEREARITARLQHPSIVSVHEAGRWPDGKPFYAMKLVSGRSLHDAMRSATTLAQRIALVPNILAVADAMAYAHSLRVIHRDLKPNNVILGEFGETVVIDWGLAKSLDDPDEPSTPLAAPGDIGGQTEFGAVLGTPGYMAPEQARAEHVDERADVFAIGVMLYRVAAGRLPWVGEDADVVAEMLAGPPRLAAAVPAIAPDLAAIAERALTPQLELRYRTARELADDLRRFTTGQLVGAHRYSTRELIKRWLRRHRTAVIVAGIAGLALATVGVISVRSVVHQRRVAEGASIRAEQRSRDAEEAMGFMLFDVAEKLRQAGRLELMNTVVRRAAGYYANTTDKDIDPTRLVAALMVTGSVLRAQGDLAGAVAEFERARTLAEAREAEGPEWRHLLVTSLNELGETSFQQGDLVKAVAHHRKALVISEELVRRDAVEPRWQRDLAITQRYLATVLTDQGRIEEALTYFRASFAIRKRLAEAPGAGPDQIRDLMMGHNDIGNTLSRGRDIAGALVELRIAVDIAEKQVAADPLGTTWQRDAAVAHERLGNVLALRGDLDAALAEFELARNQLQALVALDSANAEWLRRLAIAQDRVGTTLLDLGRHDAALAAFNESVVLRRKLVKRDPTNARWQRDLSHQLVRVGDALLAKRDPHAALAEYRAARTLREDLVKKDPTSMKWLSDLFSVRRRMGNALHSAGDIKSARFELEAAGRIAVDVAAADPSAIEDGDIVELHARLGLVLRADGESAAGKAELELALDLAKQRAAREPTDARRAATVKQIDADLAK